MPRVILVAVLLMVLAVAATAYNAPHQAVQEAIRSYSEPDVFRWLSWVDEDCGFDRADLRSDVEAELIRSRLVSETASLDDWKLSLWIEIGCIEKPSGGYVYQVKVLFSVRDDGVIWNMSRAYGSFGTTPDASDVKRSAMDSVRSAMTDFIYSHNQIDSN